MIHSFLFGTVAAPRDGITANVSQTARQSCLGLATSAGYYGPIPALPGNLQPYRHGLFLRWRASGKYPEITLFSIRRPASKRRQQDVVLGLFA